MPGFVSDKIVVNGLQASGGAGFTRDSMSEAVRLITTGQVDTDVVAGEVFSLDRVTEAMDRMTRADPARDAVRVSISHG